MTSYSSSGVCCMLHTVKRSPKPSPMQKSGSRLRRRWSRRRRARETSSDKRREDIAGHCVKRDLSFGELFEYK